MYSQIDKNKTASILLLVFFVFFVVIISFIISYGFTNSTLGSLFVGLLAFLFSLLSSMFTYFFGDSIVLSMTGAIDVSEDPNFKDLNDRVETLAIKAGIPKPRVHIIPDVALNAFATGRNLEHSHIAVTQGLMQMLEPLELEGVIAHELAHIKNFDIRLMLIVSVLAGVITTMSDFFLRSFFYIGGDDDGPNPIFLVISIFFAIFAPIIALIIQLAISRKREFLADATAIEITRHPAGLANALKKLAMDERPVARATEGNAHMFIDFPLRNAGGFLRNLFSTHPPIEERISVLEKI